MVVTKKTNLDIYKSQKSENTFGFFIKWIFKVEFIILIICFSIYFIYNLIPKNKLFEFNYNMNKIFYLKVENSNIEYSYIDINNAIYKNKNLTEQEKDFVSNILEKEIDENVKYINIENVLAKLENFQVVYSNDYEKNSDVLGSYNCFFNRVSLYNFNNAENFNFETVNKKAYFHELNHLLSNDNSLSNTMKLNANNMFLETINELFTREYFEEYYYSSDGELKLDENYYSFYEELEFEDDDYSFKSWREYNENYYNTEEQAYNEYMMYAYVLAEILPKDLICEYKFSGNESILISGLLEIDDNIEEVYNLFDSINYVLENDYIVLKNEDYEKIYNSFSYFYEKKYNESMEDNLEINLYFYNIQTQENKNKIMKILQLTDCSEIKEIIPKCYISEEYQKNHENMQIKYITKNGENAIYEIIGD